MSTEKNACQATPPKGLEHRIMDSNIPKNEQEHWAAGEIHRLRDILTGGCPIHPSAPSQHSIDDQLLTIVRIARAAGLNDAAELIQKRVIGIADQAISEIPELPHEFMLGGSRQIVTDVEGHYDGRYIVTQHVGEFNPPTKPLPLPGETLEVRNEQMAVLTSKLAAAEKRAKDAEQEAGIARSANADLTHKLATAMGIARSLIGALDGRMWSKALGKDWLNDQRKALAAIDAPAGEGVHSCWAMHHDFVAAAMDGSGDACGLMLLPGRQCRQSRSAPIHRECRRAFAPPASPEHPLTIRYTNHHGETSARNVIPKRLWFGVSKWHPEPQWLLDAHDVDKDSDRTFALSGIGQPVSPEQEAVYIPEVSFRDHGGPTCGAEFGDLEYARDGISTFCEMSKGHKFAHVDSSMAGRIAWMTYEEAEAADAVRKESADGA